MLKEVLRPKAENVLLGFFLGGMVFLVTVRATWDHAFALYCLVAGVFIGYLVGGILVFSLERIMPRWIVTLIAGLLMAVILVGGLNLAFKAIVPYTTGLSTPPTPPKINLQKIKDSGEIVSLLQPEVDVYAGALKRFEFGVYNARRYSVCIFTTVRCLAPYSLNESASNECTPGVPKGAIVGGNGFQEGMSRKWVSIREAHTIAADAVDLLPMNIQIRDAKKDTYFMELVVAGKLPADPSHPDDAKDCTGAETAIDPLTGTIASGWEEIGRKQFLVNVG